MNNLLNEAQQGERLWREVPTAERNHTSDGFYYVIYDNNRNGNDWFKIGSDLRHGGWFSEQHPDNPRVLFWLEEIPAPAPENEAVSFMQWQINERYVWDWKKEKFVAAWDNYSEHTTQQLYKEKPFARFVSAKKGYLLYTCSLFPTEDILNFNIPFTDMGDAEFLKIMPAQQLIRWITTNK